MSAPSQDGQAQVQSQAQAQSTQQNVTSQLRQQISVLRQNPKYKSLILPEQVTVNNFPFLSQQQIGQYLTGLGTFWSALVTKPETDPQHANALGKLNQFSQSLLNQLRQHKAQQQKQAEGGGVAAETQSNGSAPSANASTGQVSTSSGQAQTATPAQSTPPAQVTQAAQQTTQPQEQAQIQIPQTQQQPQQPVPQAAKAPTQTQQVSQQPNQQIVQTEDLPQDIKQRIESAHFDAPSAMSGAEAAAYRAEAQKRYSRALQEQYKAKANVVRAEQMITSARSQGKEIPQSIFDMKAQEEERYKKNQELVDALTRTQSTNRGAAAQAAARVIAGQQPNGQQIAGQNIGDSTQNRPMPQVQQQAGMTAMNPAIAAAQQQLRTSMTPPVPGQQQQPAGVTSQMSQNPAFPNSQQAFNLQRPQPNPTQATQMKYPTPTSSIAPGAVAGQSPVPLTHQAAVAAAARTHSQNTPGGLPTITGAGSFSNRPDMDKSQNQNKYPSSFNKGWTPSTPQPVSMGAARPTLSGINSGPMGVMGQPAIQKPPPFLLQGQGEHVLDKKKLDELVRQVTGGSGEGLQPEVEESVLQLADEFLDNVIHGACKLAKLRGAGTLELKDIQLVLERQYNIRIPGYATDEVRTVRKVQPAAGYLQKMNAVQASKMMGGKTDL